MGHRCNMIVTERGQHDVRYSHWGARGLAGDALTGPDPFVDMIRRCSKADDPAHRLDAVFAEGIALVDLDAKELLIWGGVGIKYLRPVRDAYLQLLTAAWPGWRVAWCYHGIADAWQRLGVTTPDVAPVIEAPDEKELSRTDLTPFTWVTVSAEGVADYPFKPGSAIILVGPALLDYCAAREFRTPPIEDSLGGGLLIEPLKKVVWWWACDRVPPDQQIRSAWNGWDVRTLDGGLPEQVSRSGRDGSVFALSQSKIDHYLSIELFPEALKHPRAEDPGSKR